MGVGYWQGRTCAAAAAGWGQRLLCPLGAAGSRAAASKVWLATRAHVRSAFSGRGRQVRLLPERMPGPPLSRRGARGGSTLGTRGGRGRARAASRGTSACARRRRGWARARRASCRCSGAPRARAPSRNGRAALIRRSGARIGGCAQARSARHRCLLLRGTGRLAPACGRVVMRLAAPPMGDPEVAGVLWRTLKAPSQRRRAWGRAGRTRAARRPGAASLSR